MNWRAHPWAGVFAATRCVHENEAFHDLAAPTVVGALLNERTDEIQAASRDMAYWLSRAGTKYDTLGLNNEHLPVTARAPAIGCP